MRHLGGISPKRTEIRESQNKRKREPLIVRPPTLLMSMDEETRKAADDLAEWAKPKTKKRTTGIGDSKFVKVLDEATEMLAKGDWAAAKSLHFVALYADLHFRVYGVEAGDMGSKERVYAAKMAKDMLAKDFGGSPDAMARFVAWTWSRERGIETWAREKGVGRGRVTWRDQFGRKLLTMFRLDEARKARR